MSVARKNSSGNFKFAALVSLGLIAMIGYHNLLSGGSVADEDTTKPLLHHTVYSVLKTDAAACGFTGYDFGDVMVAVGAVQDATGEPDQTVVPEAATFKMDGKLSPDCILTLRGTARVEHSDGTPIPSGGYDKWHAEHTLVTRRFTWTATMRAEDGKAKLVHLDMNKS